MTRVAEWSDPPQMDTGAPMPALFCADDELFLAYIVGGGSPSEQEEFAVVRFSGVLQHTFGHPNDEAFGAHPLHNLGLSPYTFNVISSSPLVAELGQRNAKAFPGTESLFARHLHWIVPFHDETLEVVGRSATVVGRVKAKDAHGAIRWGLEQSGKTEERAVRSFVGK